MGGERVALLTNGARGDVQPFMGLAVGLKEAGYHVRVLTCSDFVAPLQGLGVEAADIWHYHVEESLRENEVGLKAMATGDVAKFVEFLGETSSRQFPRAFESLLEELRSFRPHLMLYAILDSWYAQAVAAALRIPCVYAGLQLVHPSGHMQSLAGEPAWVPKRLKLALGIAFLYLWVKGEKAAKGEVVRKHCPEAAPYLPATLEGFLYLCFNLPVQPLIGVSKLLNEMQPDWPEAFSPVLTGPWVVQAEKQLQRMAEGAKEWGGEEAGRMEAFLSEGSKPVYMGWGSMISVSPEHMARLAVRTLMATGERGIVLAGFARLSPEMLGGQPDSAEMLAYARERVLFVKGAPHEALFPRCAVTVHHGGSGTTAAALRSGVPTVITPCFMDQFPNAEKAVRKGACVQTRQFMKVTVEELAAAVRRCLGDEEIRTAARALGAQLQAESGVQAAVQEVGRVLREEVATGKYDERLAEYNRNIAEINARAAPGCCAWVSRVLCSATPNDYGA